MDRNTIVRWIFIAGLMYLGYHFFFEKKSGEAVPQVTGEAYIDAPGFAPDVLDVQPGKPAPAAAAPRRAVHHPRQPLRGGPLVARRGADAPSPDRRRATPTARRPTCRRRRTTSAGETSAPCSGGPATPPSPDDQVKYDRFDWKLEPPQEPESCRFTYADDRVQIVKTISAGERPFEIDVDDDADQPVGRAQAARRSRSRRSRTDTNAEVKGKLGRVSPFQTALECARDDEVERKAKDDKVFKQPPFWFELPLVDRYAAISNYYFAQALVPLDVAPGEAGEKPACAVLAEQWYGADQKADDDTAGDIYHARLEYPGAHARAARVRDLPADRVLRPEGARRPREGGRRAAAPAGPHQPRDLLDHREGPGHDHHVDPRPHGVRQLGHRDHRADDRPAHRASSRSRGSRSRARSRCGGSSPRSTP